MKILKTAALSALALVTLASCNSKKNKAEAAAEKKEAAKIEMVKIPGKNYYASKTEVTEGQWKYVLSYVRQNVGGLEVTEGNEFSKSDTGIDGVLGALAKESFSDVYTNRPYTVNGDDYPVHEISLKDEIYFCNKLSAMENLEPVYSIDGETDIKKWGYKPCRKMDMSKEVALTKKIKANRKASGYRLPEYEEWLFAAQGGDNTKYCGSNNLSEVAWFDRNSNLDLHPVAQKKPNGYGLYDVLGNVCERIYYQFDENYGKRSGGSGRKGVIGGGYKSDEMFCNTDQSTQDTSGVEGFRVFRNAQ